MTNPDYGRDPETPEADAAEQAASADPAADESEPVLVAASLEVPEWDAWEQSRVVPVDDEER